MILICSIIAVLAFIVVANLYFYVPKGMKYQEPTKVGIGTWKFDDENSVYTTNDSMRTVLKNTKGYHVQDDYIDNDGTHTTWFIIDSQTN